MFQWTNSVLGVISIRFLLFGHFGNIVGNLNNKILFLKQKDVEGNDWLTGRLFYV